jgi:hypothetical protein
VFATTFASDSAARTDSANAAIILLSRLEPSTDTCDGSFLFRPQFEPPKNVNKSFSINVEVNIRQERNIEKEGRYRDSMS